MTVTEAIRPEIPPGEEPGVASGLHQHEYEDQEYRDTRAAGMPIKLIRMSCNFFIILFVILATIGCMGVAIYFYLFDCDSDKERGL